MAPGRKLWTTMSALAARRRAAIRPSSLLRSSPTDFLFRFTVRKTTLSPFQKGAMARLSSPESGRSTLMTSAPRSPRIMVA